MPRDEDVSAGYSGPGGGGYAGNPRGDASGFSGGGWNAASEGGDRNGYRRRRQMRLPAEFGGFKLADGRSLREVLGDRFFSAGGGVGRGKWLSKAVRDRIAGDFASKRDAAVRALGPEKLAELRAKRKEAVTQRTAQRQARLAEWRSRADAWRRNGPVGGTSLGGGS
jgi:hypothetical protein